MQMLHTCGVGDLAVENSACDTVFLVSLQGTSADAHNRDVCRYRDFRLQQILHGDGAWLPLALSALHAGCFRGRFRGGRRGK